MSRSENGWRIPFNISDITNTGLVTNLDIPIEQWPSNRPLTSGDELILGPTGYPSMGYDFSTYDDVPLDEINGEEHERRWNQWLTLGGWANANVYQNANQLPQNFLNTVIFVTECYLMNMA